MMLDYRARMNSSFQFLLIKVALQSNHDALTTLAFS